MKKGLSAILIILLILTTFTGGALSEGLPQITFEDFVGNWVLTDIDNGGGKISVGLLGLDGNISIDNNAELVLAIGNDSEQHTVQFADGKLSIIDSQSISPLYLDDKGSLVYSLPDNGKEILLFFSHEQSNNTESSALASLINKALEANKENTDQNTEEEQNKDITIQVTINELVRSGIYTGELADGIPNGQGTFVSQDGLAAVKYEGGWKDGEPSGEGYLEHEGYTIHFDTRDGKYNRTGVFKGAVVNAIPNGDGSYKSENSQGIPWEYTGAFINGQFDGLGMTVWQIDSATKHTEQGTYSKGQYTPTWSELLLQFGNNENFNVNEKSIEFINKNNKLFTTNQKINTSLINQNWNLSNFKKNPQLYCNKVIRVENLNVVQIFAYENYGRKYEFSIMEDESGTLYYGYFDGTTNITDNMFIENIYLLPLDWSTYKNVEGTDRWAVFCAYTKTINSSTSTGKVRINSGSNPNVRSAPTTDSPKVGTAKSNQVYELLAVSDNWYKIRLENGQVGWISGGMAQIIERY